MVTPLLTHRSYHSLMLNHRYTRSVTRPCLCSIWIIKMYRKVSNIIRTKSQNWNCSLLVLQLFLPSTLKSGVKSRMKMSLDRRCSNYVWVINNFTTFPGVYYIRGLPVSSTCLTFEMTMLLIFATFTSKDWHDLQSVTYKYLDPYISMGITHVFKFWNQVYNWRSAFLPLKHRLIFQLTEY